MRKLPWWVKAVALGTLAFLYLPFAATLAFSVNEAERGMVWQGFSLKWYAALWQDRDILDATRNTLVLALTSASIATVLGTLLAIGLDRFPWPRRAFAGMDLLLHLPVVTPDIILASAMIVALTLLHYVSGVFRLGMLAMILGHVTFEIPFVALVVRSRLATVGRQVDEAARDLYARTPYLYRRVTLPLLLPGVVAGGMLALTLSLDDFVISFFTSSADSGTLPLYIYAAMRKGMPAKVHALSFAIFLLTVLLVLGGQLLVRLRKE